LFFYEDNITLLCSLISPWKWLVYKYFAALLLIISSRAAKYS